MTRKLRVEYEGAIYHVVIRGVEQRRLFDDDTDRERMVDRLGCYATTYGVRLYLYCLMRNHVHLLLEMPRANRDCLCTDSRLPTRSTTTKRHRRVGHLFQGRYKAIPVEGDEYLLKLSRYIHLNPVMVGEAKAQELKERVRTLRRYVWSSYRCYIGKALPLPGLDTKPLLAMMGGGTEVLRDYRRYVETGLVERDEDIEAIKKESPWGIGCPTFLERVQEIYEKRIRACRSPEDATLRRRRGRSVEVSQIIKQVGQELKLNSGWERQQRHDLARPILAAMLCKYGGLSQREVAPLLGLTTGAAVSLQLKRLESVLEFDKDVAVQVERIEQGLVRLQSGVSGNI